MRQPAHACTRSDAPGRLSPQCAEPGPPDDAERTAARYRDHPAPHVWWSRADRRRCPPRDRGLRHHARLRPRREGAARRGGGHRAGVGKRPRGGACGARHRAVRRRVPAHCRRGQGRIARLHRAARPDNRRGRDHGAHRIAGMRQPRRQEGAKRASEHEMGYPFSSLVPSSCPSCLRRWLPTPRRPRRGRRRRRRCSPQGVRSSPRWRPHQ